MSGSDVMCDDVVSIVMATSNRSFNDVSMMKDGVDRTRYFKNTTLMSIYECTIMSANIGNVYSSFIYIHNVRLCICPFATNVICIVCDLFYW